MERQSLANVILRYEYTHILKHGLAHKAPALVYFHIQANTLEWLITDI